MVGVKGVCGFFSYVYMFTLTREIFLQTVYNKALNSCLPKKYLAPRFFFVISSDVHVQKDVQTSKDWSLFPTLYM